MARFHRLRVCVVACCAGLGVQAQVATHAAALGVPDVCINGVAALPG